MNIINYLSFSSMATFELSPQKWADMYIYKQKQRISRNMKFGQLLADSMENDELSGDPALDLMMSKLPHYDLRDKIVHDEEKGIEVMVKNYKTGKMEKHKVPFLENGKEKIPLVAKPDSAKSDYTSFLEYKTSTSKWTQKRADDSGQISFYATAMWLLTGKIPQDIELVNVQVTYSPDGMLMPTGDIWHFKTQRTMVDIIKTTKRIRDAWHGIQRLCEKELL